MKFFFQIDLMKLHIQTEHERDSWLGSEPVAIATGPLVEYKIIDAHVAAGGVAPIPLYLKQTSEFLRGRDINEETVTAANEIMQSEISPISDVRGTEAYKRLLLRQLFRAHFLELFNHGGHTEH